MTKPAISVCAENIDRENGRGAVVYEIAYPDGSFSYMRQEFRKGGSGKDETGMWWGWDGEYPLTLTPSFLCEDWHAPNDDKPTEGWKVRVHLFLRGGAIQLCADSTVDVKP